MDTKQHNPGQAFLELVVTDVANRALQVSPDKRFLFIMGEIDKICAANDARYGHHPNLLDRDRKLRQWAQAFVKMLESPGNA